MIIHKLIWRHIRHGDDGAFYDLQANDAHRWITKHIGIPGNVLELGCGSANLAKAFAARGSKVTATDIHAHCPTDIVNGMTYRRFVVGEDDLSGFGGDHDLVIMSNLFEHLTPAIQSQFINGCHQLVKPGGYCYLSWTNWLSPWGGHDFSPLHYIGPLLGAAIFDTIRPNQRRHFPYKTLFPTHIGSTLKAVKCNRHLRVKACAPRYYTEFSFIMKIPILREFLAWNCALLLQRVDDSIQ